MENQRFLVTGAAGCIGAWTLARLAGEGVETFALDLSKDNRRLSLVDSSEEKRNIRHIVGDIRHLETVESTIKQHQITHVVHLAALQVPFCQADPVAGSEVNVTGTVNVLEAVRRSEGGVRGLAYASSIAVFGGPDRYEGGRVTDDSLLAPATLYGGYKQCNEATARVYAADWGVGSVGLRPAVVYGVGRDQGLTSDPTKAMLAAAAGKSAHIAFGGIATFHHADDVAAAFIAAARLETASARIHNVGGVDAPISEIAERIESKAPAVSITYDPDPLPIPATVDGSPLDSLLSGTVSHRPLDDGIAGTIESFARLISAGLIKTSD